jgi:hypothetical protein
MTHNKYLPGLLFTVAVFLFSCKNDTESSVSKIEVKLTVQRFENDLFAIDTNNIPQAIQQLGSKYPTFTNDFIGKILGFTLNTPPDTLSKYLKLFVRDYKFVKDSAEQLYPNMDAQVASLKVGLQHVKYYFPDYKTPQKLITFIGPFDGYSDIITGDAFATGLQLHMGSNFSFYRSDIAHDIFPAYITERFTPQYIPVNLIKNVIDDIYPDNTTGKSLLEQIVDKGKRLYILDKLMPSIPGHLKIGYTEKQLKDCYTNEPVIWNFFLTNELLNITDQNITKNYVGESPKTQELGEDAPGNIGSFAGWQIVKKYMERNPSTTLQQLIKLDNREVYNNAKYKPKA